MTVPADDAVDGVADIFDAEAARNHLGVDLVAGIGMRGEHLACDLSVSWLVGSDEAELVAAEDGNQAIEQKEAGNGEEDDELPQCLRAGQPVAKPLDGYVLDPFAGRGGLLTLVHLSMSERDKAIRVLSVAG